MSQWLYCHASEEKKNYSGAAPFWCSYFFFLPFNIACKFWTVTIQYAYHCQLYESNRSPSSVFTNELKIVLKCFQIYLKWNNISHKLTQCIDVSPTGHFILKIFLLGFWFGFLLFFKFSCLFFPIWYKLLLLLNRLATERKRRWGRINDHNLTLYARIGFKALFWSTWSNVCKKQQKLFETPY